MDSFIRCAGERLEEVTERQRNSEGKGADPENASCVPSAGPLTPPSPACFGDGWWPRFAEQEVQMQGKGITCPRSHHGGGGGCWHNWTSHSGLPDARACCP